MNERTTEHFTRLTELVDEMQKAIDNLTKVAKDQRDLAKFLRTNKTKQFDDLANSCENEAKKYDEQKAKMLNKKHCIQTVLCKKDNEEIAFVVCSLLDGLDF